MIRLAIYLAFGLLCHVVFLGPHLDAGNAWTWIWVLLWPLALVITFGIVAVVICLAVGVVAWASGRL